MEENELLKICDICKKFKTKTLFYKYNYCKRCHIKKHIKHKLLEAQTANHFNLSMNELKKIMNIDFHDPTRNEIGEHRRYDEIVDYYTRIQSSVITEDIINNFLDETF